VYANVKNFTLAGNVVVNEAFKPMEIVTKIINKSTTASSNDDGSSNRSDGSNSNNNNSVATTKTILPMSVGQFYDKKERLRERIMSEAQRLNISWNNLSNRFGYNSNSIGNQPKFSNESDAKISISTFKRRMVDMGFMLTDFPDSDLAVLDPDEKSNIDTEKFLMYYKKGLEFGELDVIGPPPEPPVDDLLFKAPDLSGDLTVHVTTARFLRNATTWFNSKVVSESRDGLVHPNSSNASEDTRADNTVTSDAFSRQYIKYDAIDASKHHNIHKQNFGLMIPSSKGITNKGSKDAIESAVIDVDTSIDMINSPRSGFNSPNRSPIKGFLTTENINKHNNKSGQKSKQQQQHRDGYLVTEKSVTGMSASRRKVIEESGTIAAKRLHIDSELQSAELKRTEKLSQFRNAWKNKHHNASTSIDSAFEDKALVTVQKKVPTIRTSKQDKRAMFLLGIGNDPDAKDKDMTTLTRIASNIPSSSDNKADDDKLTSIVESNMSELKVINNRNEKQQQQGDSTRQAIKSRIRINDDIWDYLVDCVISIVASRPQNDTLKKHKAILSLKRTDISIDSYKIFSQPLSRISTPSVVLQPVKATRGHASVSRSFHQTPGRASVKSQLSALKQEKTFASEVAAKVIQVSKDRESKFQEIYRRIVLIPVTTRSDIEGDKKGDVKVGNIKSHGFLSTIFKKFDKNSNGIISRDELKLALQEMNMEVDDCDCDLIFNRFSSGTKEGIAWTRFLSFFESQSSSAMNSFASSSTSEKKEVNMIDLLNEIKRKLRDAKSEMEKYRLSTLDQLLDVRRKISTTGDDEKKSTNEDNAFKLPSDPFFQKLDISSMRVKLNRDIMRKLGISVTEDTMSRVSRIFLYSNTLLMKFVDSNNNSSSSGGRDDNIEKTSTLHAVLKYANQILSDGMHQRMGSSSDTSVLKLWISIASSQDSIVSFEDIAAYFMQLLLESPETKKTTVSKSSNGDNNTVDSREDAPILSVSATSDLKKDSTQYLMKISDDNVVLRNLDVSLLSRIIADHVIASVWNNPQDDNTDNKSNTISPIATATNTSATTATSTSTTNTNTSPSIAISAAPSTTPTCLSYSGLSAYLRRQRIHHLEMKFKFIMQMEAAHMRSTTTMMVHVYINGRQDEMILLAHDPISGEVLKLNVKQDLKGLPSRDKLDVLFESHSEWMDELCRKNRNWFNPESIYFFNPWNTPIEDKCISDFIERLNVVRTSPTSSYLHIGEDPKFVNVLRKILQDSSALPIFCSVNNLVMTFEVDENNLITSDNREVSLRAFIFNKIRHYKKLYSFIVNSQSSLNIVLTTYNGGLREVMKWSELLAHLTNNRNPFFTIQLLPKVFKPDDPDDYFYYLDDHDHTIAYSLQDGRSDASEMMIQRSFIDLDGAPHPSWNQKFKFKFTQPLLTSCRVVSSEVIKIKVDLQDKYVILLLRDSRRSVVVSGGPDKFRFITIYDPRSATEYQCGVKEGCKLYNALYYGTIDESVVVKRSSNKATRGSYDNFSNISDSDYMTYIVEASEQQKIVLGPAITPRLEIHVYNDNGRSQELLGSAQISISSVLSGTGIVEKRWHCLNYKVDNNNTDAAAVSATATAAVTKSIDVIAGDIELEMKFVSHGILEAEKISEFNVEKRKSKLKSANKLSETTTKYPTAGDQELNVDANDGDDNNRKEGSKGKGVGTLSSTRKELESLKMEKDSLALQCQKLRDKLSNGVIKDEKSNLDDKIIGELQVTKEQNDKLAKENKTISDEKQQLVAEIAKLKNQIKGSQQQSSVATSSSSSSSNSAIASKLEKENSKLLEENKRLKEVEATARKQLELLKSKEDEKGVVKSVMTVLPSITAVDGIVKVLLERYQKRRSNGGASISSSTDSPLDSLQRLLSSYSSKGSIASKHIHSSLSDLMIDVPMDQVMKVCEEIGYEDPSAGVVSTSKVLDYFKRQLDSLSGNKDSTTKKDNKVLVDHPPVTASALSKPAISEEVEVRSSKDESKDRMRPKSAMEASSSSPLPSGPQNSNNHNNTTLSSSSSGGIAKSVDWSREPVTYPWERRFHTETNKVSTAFYLYVCMYVCMYVCSNECMYGCMYECMHVCIYVRMFAYMYVCRWDWGCKLID
jgi:hypothetical protein